MPISFLKCQHNWLPPIAMALEKRRPLSWRVHDAMVFTHSLTEVLPDFAKKAVEEGDNKPLDGVVTVEPVCFHPWSKNVSTFCYEIQPGDGGLTDTHHQQARRAVIYASLRRDISSFVEEYDDVMLL